MKNQEAIVSRMDKIESVLEEFTPKPMISLTQSAPGVENRGDDDTLL